MSVTGTVFDIKELAVFDGPGLRVTVFLKGCPLRCQWCHNPEGLSFTPQLMVSHNGCLNCKKCIEVCPSPAQCTNCGRCVDVCPRNLRRIAGTVYTPSALAALLLKDADYLKSTGGGYTISGGEPTSQPDFLLEVLSLLKGSHRAIETCGYCSPDVFYKVLQNLEYVMMDLKLADPVLHKQYTGVDNRIILQNLEQLKNSGLPFVIRIPMIPGVNDTEANMQQTAALLVGCPTLQQVELLPYHITAGAKYSMVGKQYSPSFDTSAAPALFTHFFEQAGIPCKIL
ncbi:MAG: glycyl-radical enzyme activating protein [Oscillospiraceae bacterium]